MAERLWLIRRTKQGESNDRNQVNNVLINIDDGDDDATKKQGTVDALNIAVGRPQNVAPSDRLPAIYPDGYFNEFTNISDLSETGVENLRTEGDYIAYGPAILSELTDGI